METRGHAHPEGEERGERKMKYNTKPLCQVGCGIYATSMPTGEHPGLIHKSPYEYEHYPKDYFYTAKERRRLGNILRGAWRRCYVPETIGFANWGGRGIKMTEPWYDKEKRRINERSFFEWAYSHGWESGLQLDRIDVNGDYGPGNCRFVTCRQNQRNRRSNRRISFRGKTMCLVEWAEEVGIPYHILKNRMHCKWDVSAMLTTPLMPNERFIEYRGEKKRISEWAKILGINVRSLSDRLDNGWSIEDAVTKPNNGGHNRKIEFNGETRTIKDWAKWAGIGYRALLGRLADGWNFELAVTTPTLKVGQKLFKKGSHK